MNEEKKNDSIGDALNMRPMEVYDPVKSMINAAHDDSATEDFTYARANIRDIIDTGTDSLQKLAEIADQSQHPRAFEVMSALMKTIVDANKDLMDLQKKIRDIDTLGKQNDTKNITTNNLFVGSTTELQKMIQDMKKDV
jgi:hypothetical protein